MNKYPLEPIISRRTFLAWATVSSLALLPLLMGGCVQKNLSEKDSKRTVVDMAGREVILPTQIHTLYSTGQPGVVAVYMLAPDRLLGWCIKPSAAEAAYLEPEYLNLPTLGLMQGENNTANREEIMAQAPDVILLMTSLATDSYREGAVTDADSIQKKMGIPTVVADYDLDAMGETFRFLGELLDVSQRAATLAHYCESVYSNALEKAATIPLSARVPVYYAQGQNGLQTAPQYSAHSEVLDLVGANNVVKLDFGSNGRVNVDMEQVIIWNPNVIITSYSMSHNASGDIAFAFIEEGNKSWAEISAVQTGRIYNTPALPFNWQDMPPSANRFIGILWLGNLLYPQVFVGDIVEETRTFYQLFYRIDLSDEQLHTLLQHATA